MLGIAQMKQLLCLILVAVEIGAVDDLTIWSKNGRYVLEMPDVQIEIYKTRRAGKEIVQFKKNWMTSEEKMHFVHESLGALEHLYDVLASWVHESKMKLWENNKNH